MTNSIKGLILLAVLICLPITLLAKKPDNTNALEEQRKRFLAAERLIEKGHWKKFQREQAALKDYPLHPYLVYKALKHKIRHDKRNSVPLSDIQNFVTEYPDFPFNTYLQKKWLLDQYKKGYWQNILKALKDHQPLEETYLKCYSLTSQYKTTQNLNFLKSGVDLWLVAHSQPESCDLLFRLMEEKGVLTTSLKFERFALVIQERNFALAGYLMRKLPKKEQHIAGQWLKLNKSPQLIFSKKTIENAKLPKEILTEVLATSVEHLARKDAGKALIWWEKNQSKYSFTLEQTKRINRDIGVFLSHEKHAKALEFLSKIPNDHLDEVGQAWRVRMSIYNENWSEALKWINALPKSEQTTDKWQYWRARALYHLNNKNAADQIFKEVAQSRNYYGFMASMKLDIEPNLNNDQLKIQSEILNKLKRLPAYLRAIELLNCNRPRIARIEWYQLTKDMPEIQLLHLAKLAFDNKWYDLSILTMTKAQNQNDLALRFPLAFEKDIKHFSQKHQLDPAWVFALARQESAFFSHAKSPVGARGLMQLMPSTASYIAKMKKISYGSHWHLYTPNKNIELGTSYLKFLKAKWQNNPILATASYNAGPSRIKRWLPKAQLPSDIWIDNIPYEETRNYVKNVMAFTGIYHQMLGDTYKLKAYMKDVKAR